MINFFTDFIVAAEMYQLVKNGNFAETVGVNKHTITL